MQTFKRIVIALALTALVAGSVVLGIVLLYNYQKRPLPLSDQCVAVVAGDEVSISTEQARNAAIVAGVSQRRGLIPRAATIGLATVYQESGIINLDYGDRDSLGLFQQRPSQGWGTQAQVMDPWYASDSFYAALVKVPNWQTGDVNDVAQTVQRSGHPNGYARHVENARRLASSLTGETPASFRCLVRNAPTADPAGLASFLKKTLPTTSKVAVSGKTLTVTAANQQQAWSAAHIVLATMADYGTADVQVGGLVWRPDAAAPAAWQGNSPNGRTVTVTYPA